ncbi:MAG: ABC transporter permease [Clostridia bacterium]|nr:ABC transporter permease [Clostridia bacterium]
MKRIFAFANRVFLELIRDPLSYLFALGFPLVMLGIMTIVNASIPEEAGMTLFEPVSLVPGISVFGLTFLTLFTALLLASDRENGFLMRVTVSPMRTWEFLAGYLLPVLLLAALQGVITYAAGWILSAVQGEALPLHGIFAAMLVCLPSAVFFIALGFLFGCLLGVKSAPGVASVIISAASMLGGIWMDVDALGGVWLSICRILPFYHAVRAARAAVSLTAEGLLFSVIITAFWAGGICFLSVMVFKKKCRMIVK